MKKMLSLAISSYLFAWQMQGFTSPINASSVKTWCYQNGWKNNFNYGNYPQISTISGGEACWVSESVSLNEDKLDTYNWHEGWNFVTPIFENWNLDDKFRGNALIGWRYINKKWEVYNYSVDEFNKFDNLNIGEGMFVYIPKIISKINTQALFCKQGECSKIYTKNKEYKFYLKAPTNSDIKIAIDLYRYSNNTHYKIALGPFKVIDNQINSQIPTCVEKEKVGGSCNKIDNTQKKILSYKNGYLMIDAQKIADVFNKTIPNTKEKFLVKLYIEGFNLDNFVDEKFGTLGIEGFGTWVSLENSKRIEFELELK